jgi:O-methyltransferase
VKALIKNVLRKCGFDLIRYHGEPQKDTDPMQIPSDFDPFNKRIFESVKDYTMTSPERTFALTEAVRYLVKSNIEGAFVECGVWKGGSIMAMLLTLLELNCDDREIFLYDTFAGMSEPTNSDFSYKGERASDLYQASLDSENVSKLCYATLDEVKQNVLGTGYPKEKIHFIKGKVEDTIPKTIPEKIALLRLDTDWYESTKHELQHLFPRLCAKGVLICDDYGHWEGARKAMDDYLEENNLSILLNRIDYTGRIGIKP